MFQLAIPSQCSACETTAAQWARANASPPPSKLSSPGKPYPIPPTFGSESHPYAKQIGQTEIMVVPKLEVPQNKGWVKPEYDVVVKKKVDMECIKELIANIHPPGVPPRHLLSGPDIPPPRPYVPTPPYEHLSSFKPEDFLQSLWPNVPLPPRPGKPKDDALPTPRPNVPLPPDAPPNQGLSGFQAWGALPTPRPNVPLPPDAPPNQSLSAGLPTPRPNVPLPPDAPPNQ
ncbi:hypothetical protein V492_07338 [Pseudogymnoascus sp. VKM F-4246]|nr:hypothetical protein V492_07338 [Pseudogymnoascus sp. VKM F-4246]